MVLSMSSAQGQTHSYAWGSGIYGGSYGNIHQVAIASDKHNDLVAVGNYSDSLEPISLTNNVTTGGGMYINKYDSSGTLLWTKYISTTYNSFRPNYKHQALDVAVDSSNNIYAFGYSDTVSVNFNHQSACYFLNKYNSSGTLLSTTYFDNRTNYVKGSCAVAPDQSIYVSLAYQNSLVLPTTTLQTHNALNYAFVLLHLDANGVENAYMDFGGKKPWISDISCSKKTINVPNSWGLEGNFMVTYVGTYDSLAITTSPGVATCCGSLPNMTGVNGFSGMFSWHASNKVYSYYPMVNFLPGRNGYIQPVSVSCDSDGHNFITGKFIGDAAWYRVWHIPPFDTLSSIAFANDTDVFYGRDSIAIGWEYIKVIPSVGNDQAGDMIRYNANSTLLSVHFANGGITLAGHSATSGNALIGVGNSYYVTDPMDGVPQWILQQGNGYTCNINSLAKSQSTYFGGNTKGSALFYQNQIFHYSQPNDSTGFVGKLDGINCTMLTNISGTDTILQCQNTAPINASTSGGSGNYAYSWTPSAPLVVSNGPTTVVNKQVDMQKFVVTVTDLTTGCISKDSVVVGVYLVHNDTLYSCHTAPVTLDMGAGATQYNWLNTSPQLTTQTYTVNTPGTYYGTAGYYNSYASCGTLTNRYVVKDSCACTLAATFSSITPVSCYGGTNGSATLTVTGNTGPVLYAWGTTPMQTTATATGLAAGTYYVSVIDTNGCVISKQVTITQPNLWSVQGQVLSGAGCNTGSHLGSATVNTFIPGAYTYLWSNGWTLQTATNLAVGVYTVTVTNGSGCTASDVITIPQSTLNANIPGDTILSCQHSAIVAVGVSGGSGRYAYNWTPVSMIGGTNINGPTVVVSNQVDMQKLKVTVYDSTSGCSSKDSVVVGVYLFYNDTIYACHNFPVTLNLGDGASSYDWYNTATPANSFQYLVADTPGTYYAVAGYYHPYANCGLLTSRFVVKDSCACTLTASVTLNPISCYGTNTGGAIVTASGGTGNYTYTWSTIPVVHSAIITGLAAGSYSVTISDNNGCSVIKTIVLTQPGPLTTSFNNIVGAGCTGTNHGSATVITSGGTMPYSYNWSTAPAQHTITATSLGFGSYSVTVTDAHFCTVTNLVAIPQNTLTVFMGPGADTVISCTQPGAAIWGIGSGGTGPYVYHWSNGQYLVADNGPTTLVNKQVDMEKFVLTVTDTATGCTAKDSVVVGAYFQHDDTLFSCSGATVTLDLGPGGWDYVWGSGPGNNTRTITVTSPGAYNASVTYPCGTFVDHFLVLDSCTTPDIVWPGDANSNGTADLYDVLNIGIGYNNTGPVRTNASTVWVGQPASNWPLQFLNGVNLKHADCDGNGAIDSVDVDVVALNYGLTHAKTAEAQANPLNPDLYVQFTVDSATNNNLVTANVFLGRASHPVSNGYGLAYSLFYDPALVDTNIAVSYAGSWLGQNNIPVHLVKNLHTNGRIDLAYSRTNHTNVAGYGQVAAISFYIQDNIIGKQDSLFKKLGLQISGAKLVSSSGAEVDLNVQNDTITVYQLNDGIGEAGNGNIHVDVYPNPGDGKFILKLKGNDAIKKVTLVNTIGQSLLSKNYEATSTNGTYLFDSGIQAAGMYFLKIETISQVVVQRVIIN